MGRLLPVVPFLSLILFVLLASSAAAHGGGSDDDADGDSGGAQPNLRAKSLILAKVWCLIIIFVATFVGGVSPYYLKWNKVLLVLGTQFAGGVFLGTALMHFLSDSNETFEDLTDKEYPFAFMLASAAFIVGPVPVDDGIGKEVAVQIATPMMTNKTFYTDSNGRDFLKRVRDYRSDWELQVNQPVAGNYYPINLGIYIQDNSTELSVLVDRPVGGSSVFDGQIELMLHRRLLHDDGRGVAESLDEEVCVSDQCAGLVIQGKFYIRIDPLGEGAKWRRSAGQEIYSPLLLAFSKKDARANWADSHRPTFSMADPSYSLPDNVALTTLQALEDGSTLLRLAHLYEVGEDQDLSVMARVDLDKLFSGRKIRKITETNLSANQERVGMEKKRLKWFLPMMAQVSIHLEIIKIHLRRQIYVKINKLFSMSLVQLTSKWQ